MAQGIIFPVNKVVLLRSHAGMLLPPPGGIRLHITRLKFAPQRHPAALSVQHRRHYQPRHVCQRRHPRRSKSVVNMPQVLAKADIRTSLTDLSTGAPGRAFGDTGRAI